VLDSSIKENSSQTASKISSSNKIKPFSEAFVSVQMEKVKIEYHFFTN
jgi:hypothetical protein